MKLVLLTSSIVLITLMIQSGQLEKATPSKNSVPGSATSVKISEGCLCYEIWEPVCANDGQTYPNSCFLNCARREDHLLLGLCEGECPCCKPPYQNEPIEEIGWGMPFNGYEGNAPHGDMMVGPYYGNPGSQSFQAEHFKKESSKEENAKLGFMSGGSGTGRYPEENGCFCTSIYMPVCGSNNVTYDNLCLLKCATKTDTCLTQACEGKCPCCSCSSGTSAST